MDDLPRVRRHNLPAPRTSFVGREHKASEILRTLGRSRLVTLAGIGGSGETRLALEAARDLADAYPGGTWLVELAPLEQEALVPHSVAEALGVREQPGRSLIVPAQRPGRSGDLPQAGRDTWSGRVTGVVPRTRSRISRLSPPRPCSDPPLLPARYAAGRTPRRSAPSPPVCRQRAPCRAQFR
jgi:hypothetical protein